MSTVWHCDQDPSILLDRTLIRDSLREWQLFPPAQRAWHTARLLSRYNVRLPSVDMDTSRIPKCWTNRFCHAYERNGRSAGTVCERGREDISSISSKLER